MSTSPRISLDLSLNKMEGTGFEITNQTGISNDGTYINNTIFTSTNPDIYDPNISENLTEEIKIYDDEIDNSENKKIVDKIKDYANKINCSDFHGKGTIDDYAELFKAASKIANETKQIELDVDIEGFNEFGQAADELSNLFENFTLKLQNINIINDIHFLNAIANALEKIWKLSEIFGKFKDTIISTTTIKIPKSAHDTKVVLEGVMEEINCAMKYINHFVDPSSDSVPLDDAELTTDEKNIIQTAISTIDNWNSICEQGVSVAMSNNTDIQYIKHASDTLKNTTTVLKTATQNLRNKLKYYSNM